MLESSLRDAGCTPEVPDSLPSWLATAAFQAVVVQVQQVADLEIVTNANVSGARFVVAIIPQDDPKLCIDALRAGAHGVALGDDPRAVCNAVMLALQGHINLPYDVVMEMASPTPPVEMSSDEISLLRNLAQGRAVKTIANRTYSSRSDMYRRLRRLYDKIGVKNRSQAVAWAAQYGLIGDTAVVRESPDVVADLRPNP